jgi:superfamily II DNA or RNA helicase
MPLVDTSFRDFFERVRDFGLSEKDVRRCARRAAKKYKITESEVYKISLTYLLSRERRCIRQATKHDMRLEHYQRAAVEHMLVHRSLIVAFDVGTGKTLTAVTVASCILSVSEFLGIDIRVIVITPTSLQANFKKEMKAYGSNPNDKRYKFYTIAGFGNAYKRGEIDCSRSLMIIDEAHNLRTDYRHEFQEIVFGQPKENTRAEMVVKCASQAWKTLLLTADPVYDYDYHIVNLVSIAKGQYPPMTQGEFLRAQTSDKNFLHTFGCLFAFYKSPPETKHLYPERKDEIVFVEMTPEYYRKYLSKAQALEKKKKKPPRRTRSIGNLKVTIKDKPDDDKKKGGKDTLMVKLRQSTLNIEPYLKQEKALEIIQNGKKTLVFSEFLGGVKKLQKLLDEEDIEYLQITGSVSKAQREKIVQEARRRKGPNVLFISKAGGEGLDLRGFRQVIFLEKGWTVAGEHQVAGRVIRKGSHLHLPLDERNVIVYHLVMSLPESVVARNRLSDPQFNVEPDADDIIKKAAYTKNEGLSADEYLHFRSRGKYKTAMAFKKRLEEVDIFHIDCHHKDFYLRKPKDLKWSYKQSTKFIPSRKVMASW